MFIRIGCDDGHVYESDVISREEIQEALDESDGYLGEGDYLTHVDSVDEAIQWMLQFLKYDTSNDTQVFSIPMNERERTFNTRHVVWWELVE